MTTRETALAIALRQTQWLLDEAAFNAGGGRLTGQDCQQLGQHLRDLAEVLDTYPAPATRTKSLTQ